MDLPGHAPGQVFSGKLARFQPIENCALVHAQLCCSPFYRVGTIFPLRRVALVLVQLHCRDLPLLTQVTDDLARNGVNESRGLIPLALQCCCNLSIHQPCCVEFMHTLFERLCTSKHGIAAHPALIPELLLRPCLPIDLDLDLAVSPRAHNDDLSNHQAQHLFALRIGGRGRLPERW